MSSNGLKKIIILGISLLTLSMGSLSWATEGVNLSASPEVSATPEGQVKMPKQQEKMALNYVNQPPMIPHSVEGYQVTKNTNRCLDCHGVQHYRTTGAPRISPTHFMDSQGKLSSSVSPRRYFCLSCHVPQTDAPPIVGNSFKPAPGFGQQ